MDSGGVPPSVQWKYGVGEDKGYGGYRRLAVQVLSSRWWMLVICAIASTMTLSNYLFLSNGTGSQGAVRRVAGGIIITVLVTDTALQRLCHYKGYNNLDFRSWVLEIIDGSVLICYVVGMVLLSQLNAGDGRTFTSAELEEATDLALLARTVAHSLLLVGLLRLCTAVFRYLAWRSHLDRGAMGRDTSFRNFRRLLMYVTMIVIFNIVVTVFVVMVMVDNEGLFSGLSTENATVMVVTLSAARTRHEFDSAASSFFDALHIRNESCTRIIEFRRGDWVFTTGETYDLTITLVSADGSTTARLSPEKCVKERSNAEVIVKVISLFGFIGYITTNAIISQGKVLIPLLRVLQSVIRVASHLTPSGMLRDPKTLAEEQAAGQTVASRTLESEEAVDRLKAAITLLLKASVRGRAVVRHMMAEANKVAREHDVGLLDMYGMRDSHRGPGAGATGALGTRSTHEGPLMSNTGDLAEGRVKSRTHRKSSAAWKFDRPSEAGGAAASALEEGGSRHAGVPKKARRTGHGESGTGHDASPLPATAFDLLGELSFNVLSHPRSAYVDLIVAMFRKLDLLEPALPSLGERDSGSAPNGSRLASGDEEMVTREMVGRGSGLGGTFKRPKGFKHGASLRGKSARSRVGSGVFVREKVLRTFVQECAKRYLDNPYHRWEHAVDVTHSVFTFLEMASLLRDTHLSRLDVLCLMIAAIAHDMGHRGVSNSHLVKTGDLLAVTYNDKSPQEAMHVSSLFQLCQKIQEANVFECLSEEQYAEARKLIIELILDTDMAHHFSRVAALEAVYSSTSGPADDANEGIEGGSSVRGSFSFKVTPMVSDVEHVSALTRADVRCIMLGLLHAADIGNCVKPVDLHVAWSVKVVREFFYEAKLQKELGMTPLPFMDPDKCFCPQSQMDFLDFVARPLFVVLARIIPEFKPLVAHLAQNYHFWTALAWEEAVAQGYKGAKGKEERPSGARPSASGGRTEAPISPEVVAVEEPDRKRASGAGDSAFPRIKEVDQWTVGMTRVGGGVGMPAVDVTGLDMGLLAECVNELGVLGVREVPEAIMSADLRGKVGSFLKKLDL